MILERVRGDVRLFQVGGGKGIAIHDQDAVHLEVFDIGLERGRIHGHQHVHRIARCEDVARGKLNLESADARESAGRGANFSGIIGERSEVVSVQRHGVGELTSGNLHSVARISAEAENGFIDDFALVHADDWVRNGSHVLVRLQSWIIFLNHPVCPKKDTSFSWLHVPRMQGQSHKSRAGTHFAGPQLQPAPAQAKSKVPQRASNWKA